MEPNSLFFTTERGQQNGCHKGGCLRRLSGGFQGSECRRQVNQMLEPGQQVQKCIEVLLQRSCRSREGHLKTGGKQTCGTTVLRKVSKGKQRLAKHRHAEQRTAKSQANVHAGLQAKTPNPETLNPENRVLGTPLFLTAHPLRRQRRPLLHRCCPSTYNGSRC